MVVTAFLQSIRLMRGLAAPVIIFNGRPSNSRRHPMLIHNAHPHSPAPWVTRSHSTTHIPQLRVLRAPWAHSWDIRCLRRTPSTASMLNNRRHTAPRCNSRPRIYTPHRQQPIVGIIVQAWAGRNPDRGSIRWAFLPPPRLRETPRIIEILLLKQAFNNTFLSSIRDIPAAAAFIPD